MFIKLRGKSAGARKTHDFRLCDWMVSEYWHKRQASAVLIHRLMAGGSMGQRERR